MQPIIVDQPYRFVPPGTGPLWCHLLKAYVPAYLRSQGVQAWTFKGVERLKASMADGHGVLLAPNHCRPCDPVLMGLLAAQAGCQLHIMTGWHFFKAGGILPWMGRKAGAFSVYREGADPASIRCAIRIVTEGRRPLLVFPEGLISRTNERLSPLHAGAACIAQRAALRKRDHGLRGGVVVHPVAIRYFHTGEGETCLNPGIESLERRLGWKPASHLRAHERLVRLGEALLGLRERKYYGASRTGSPARRLRALAEHILRPLEARWPIPPSSAKDRFSRIKSLRASILRDMVHGGLDDTGKARCWKHQEDLYFAQQLHLYTQASYDPGAPSTEQMLETLERFVEDLDDTVPAYAPLHAVAEIGDPIVATPSRWIKGRDSITPAIRESLEARLAALPRP